MPQIKFTKDVNPKKGWTTGEVRFWPPSLVRAVSAQIGNTDWYELVPEETARQRLMRLRGTTLAPAPEVAAPGPKRGRGRPRTPATVLPQTEV